MTTISIANRITGEILEISELDSKTLDILEAVLDFIRPACGEDMAWDVYPDDVSFDDEEEGCDYDDYPRDYDLECGFDPYEGCYTFDC